MLGPGHVWVGSDRGCYGSGVLAVCRCGCVCVVHRFGQTLIAAAVPIIYLCLRSAMRLVRDGDASFALLHVVHTSYGHTNFWVKGCSGAQLWGQLPDPGPQLLGQPPRGGQHAHLVSRAPWLLVPSAQAAGNACTHALSLHRGPTQARPFPPTLARIPNRCSGRQGGQGRCQEEERGVSHL